MKKLNSDIVNESGIKYPIFISDAVNELLLEATNIEKYCQDYEGRLWDMLTIFRLSLAKYKMESKVFFAPLFRMRNGRLKKISMVARCEFDLGGTPIFSIDLS